MVGMPSVSPTTKTLSIANQKGGVGKTTTTASVGAALVELGRRVLLVDLDPQAGLTFSLGVDPEDVGTPVGSVLLGKAAPADAVIEIEAGLHLLPANIELTHAEELLVSRTGREQRLRVSLDKIAADYDWILIDCPPTLGILTVGALTASDLLLIPLQAETLAHRGVGQLLDTVYDIRQFVNPALEIWGVLPTMFDSRTKHAHAVVEAIRETYELTIIEPAIPKSIRFAEAPAYGATILSTAKSHKGAEAYRAVARRLLDV